MLLAPVTSYSCGYRRTLVLGVCCHQVQQLGYGPLRQKLRSAIHL